MSQADSIELHSSGAGFLLTFAPPLILMASAWAGQSLGHAGAWAALPLVVVYALVPLINALVSSPEPRLEPEAARLRASSRRYPAIVLTTLPVQIVTLFVATAHFVSGKLEGIGLAAWILSTGVCSALFAINAAHDLIHRRHRGMRTVAAALLTTVYFATFRVAHLRVHHRQVGTDLDFESARRGQSLYAFWLQALRGHARVLAGHCDGALLDKRELRACLAWYCLGAAVTTGAAIVWGGAAALFLLAQGLVAILKLESINYLQHYGLRRKVDDSGEAEPVAPRHAWSQEHLVTNLALLNLMYHADHHVHPNKPYQLLERCAESRVYRRDFSVMLMLALLPPVFYRHVHPILDRQTVEQQRDPDKRDRTPAEARSTPDMLPSNAGLPSHQSKELAHTLQSES